MLSEEIIAIYEKSALERREMILGHIEKLKPIDEQLITSALKGFEEFLYSDTPKNENETAEELSAFVQKERLAVLNLCLPEAKEKTNE